MRRRACATSLLALAVVAPLSCLPASGGGANAGDRADAGDAGDAGDADPPPRAPLGRSTPAIVVDGVERRYVLHVPAAAAAGTPLPLVVALHGTGGSGDGFANQSGWVDVAEDEGVVVVFPSALRYCFTEDVNFNGVTDGPDFSLTEKWSDGKLGTATQPLCNVDQLARLDADVRAGLGSEVLRDDLAFLRAVVDDVARGVSIDAARRYVAGFSNGGNLAARALVQAPDVFAAAHVGAGFLNVDDVAASPRRALVSFGTLDGPSLARTGAVDDPEDDLAALPAGAAVLDEPSTAARVVDWKRALALDDPGVGVDLVIDGEDAYRHDYADADGAALSLLVVQGMPHVYGNGANHPVAIARVAWDFFAR